MCIYCYGDEVESQVDQAVDAALAENERELAELGSESPRNERELAELGSESPRNERELAELGSESPRNEGELAELGSESPSRVARVQSFVARLV